MTESYQNIERIATSKNLNTFLDDDEMEAVDTSEMKVI